MKIKIFKKDIENSTDELMLESSVNQFMKGVTVKDVKMSFTSRSVAINEDYLDSMERGKLYLVVVILYEPKEETI